MVTAAEDEDAVDDTVTLTHTARIGETPVTLRKATVAVTVEDKDTQGVTVTMTETGVMVPEAGDAGTYEISLKSEPTGRVTVTVEGASGDITVSPSTLFFDPDDSDGKIWSTPQTVSVYAAKDADAEPDDARLTHTVHGGDYTGVAAGSVNVTVEDAEENSRAVSVEPQQLRIHPNATDSYTVVLDTKPTGTVRVRVTKSGAATMTGWSVSPVTLDFNATNWNRPKKVTVQVPLSAVDTVVADADARGG